MKPTIAILAATLLFPGSADAASPKSKKIPKPATKAKSKAKKKKAPQPFRWINNPAGKLPTGVEHHTYRSQVMDVEIGYCIYFPPSYQEFERRFPVVYYLHGGRPGSELKSVKLAAQIREQHTKGKVKEAIYVFVNGGLVSHYNMPQQGSWGEWT
ncbi:MAG: alpha/beta hydrolase-fold protein, partial [Limisphaerales bacterium]